MLKITHLFHLINQRKLNRIQRVIRIRNIYTKQQLKQEVNLPPKGDPSWNYYNPKNQEFIEDETEDDNIVQRGTVEASCGKASVGLVVLPVPLSQSITHYLSKCDKNQLRADALKIYDHLRSKTSFHESMDNEDNNNQQYYPVPKFERAKNRKRVNNPIPNNDGCLEYNKEEQVQSYLSVLMSSTYAGIYHVLSQITKRVPTFSPVNILDYGCGPATVLWACNEIFQPHASSKFRYEGVDISENMLNVAQLLIDDAENMHKAFDTPIFKRHLSYTQPDIDYNLVTCAYTLSELPTDKIREHLLTQLWNSTTDFLVLIERGTPHGYEIVDKARSYLLNLNSTTTSSSCTKNVHVFAPCPHEKICPMSVSNRTSTCTTTNKKWCHFSQRFQRSKLMMEIKKSKLNFEDSKFTYLILRKTPRPTSVPIISTNKIEEKEEIKMIQQSYQWPRIIDRPKKRGGHVIIPTCNSHGELSQVIIAKSHGKLKYRDARKSSWGDLFPV